MTRSCWLLAIALLSAACADDPEPASSADARTCVPDSVAMGGGDTLTTASQRAIFAAVLDSVRNLYGNTDLYLDPRVEIVGRDIEFTRLHEPELVEYLLASQRFADLCQVDAEKRCDVDAPGVSVRFSGLLRARGTDRVLVDMTQQTVRPMRDSSDWFVWATWVRYWVAQDGRCWYVTETELKGTV